MIVDVNNNPKVTDTIQFTLNTTDANGAPHTPYEVNSVTIYYLERSFTTINDKTINVTVGGMPQTSYFNDSVLAASFGSPLYPAWLSTDTGNAFLTQVLFDASGNPLLGVFNLQWTPSATPLNAREGDYILCFTWTPIAGGTTISDSMPFYLIGDTSQTTSIPTHYTPPLKYSTLLERYLPEMFKMLLASSDLSPDVLNRTNLAVAQGFTDLENLTNQIVDLIDANSVQEALLPYLSNLFNWKLKSTDIQLWRRQIKQAVPLYKQKGTLAGLTGALAECGMTLNSFSQLWQVVSSSTWVDAFIVTDVDDPFILTKLAELDHPLDAQNFDISIRLVGSTTYEELTLDYVSFSNLNGVTTVTWVGNFLSINPITLKIGDVVKILYKIATPANQAIENYIRTLPLADQRDELTVTFPLKNWNVRLIDGSDPLFEVICPSRHPYHEPVIYGKVRTEFPYSENIWNMSEYNGQTEDSTNPCDIDKTFLDSCSCCISSKFNISLNITNLTPDRLTEANDIITDFVPFHAIPQNINYTGVIEDVVLSPMENIEALITFQHNDNLIMTQFDFNRLIRNGSSDALTIKRNMLATANVIATPSGTGTNIAIVLFSPGIQFDTLGVNPTENVLEILSGTSTGKYPVQIRGGDRFVIDVLQGMPSTVPFPIDPTGFPFRLSNIMFNESSASIYQDNQIQFLDSTLVFPNLGTQVGWSIVVISGPFMGTYPITQVNPDGSLYLSGWTGGNTMNLSYQLRNGSTTIASSTSGQVLITLLGRVEIQLVTEELGIRQLDYVLFNGVQYQITRIVPRTMFSTVDKVYISGYSFGTVVGSANVTFYRRLIDNATGYLDIRGMQLVGQVPVVDGTLENNTALDNYLILIGTTYYQIASIVGSTMTILGPILPWGLTGTPVSYSIVQFIKTSPITTEDGVKFLRLDRRGNDSITITTQTQMPMGFRSQLLNDINKGDGVKDSVSGQESITLDIEYR